MTEAVTSSDSEIDKSERSQGPKTTPEYLSKNLDQDLSHETSVSVVGNESNFQLGNLISDHIAFTKYIVRTLIHKFNLPIELVDEFTSAGYLGLVEAAARFDFKRQSDFRRYAYLRIRGAVIDNIRSNSDLRGAAYKAAKAAAAITDFQSSEEENRQAKEGERDAVQDLSQAATLASSIFRLVYVGEDGQNQSAVDEVAEKDAPDYRLTKTERTEQLRELMVCLTVSERLVIEQFYFYDRSFTEIANENPGLSKSWVSRLHSKAISKLRVKLRDAKVDIWREKDRR